MLSKVAQFYLKGMLYYRIILYPYLYHAQTPLFYLYLPISSFGIGEGEYHPLVVCILKLKCANVDIVLTHFLITLFIFIQFLVQGNCFLYLLSLYVLLNYFMNTPFFSYHYQASLFFFPYPINIINR